jgi:hypothetical protein
LGNRARSRHAPRKRWRNDRAPARLHVGAATRYRDRAGALADPKPGAQINPGKAEYAAPDAYAFRRAGRWQVSLSPNCQPSSASMRTTSLMARAQRDDASYLRAIAGSAGGSNPQTRRDHAQGGDGHRPLADGTSISAPAMPAGCATSPSRSVMQIDRSA